MALIYCVEDDDGIRELISCALKSGGYEVKAFPKAKPFYEEIRNKEPSLVLLDIMLPDEDGYSILSKLKKDSHTQDVPVIMLTAKSSELDKVSGLEMGADDYITKPFGVMELLSRIKAVLRRAGKQNAEADVIEEQGVSLDASRRICSYNGQEVVLTYKEFELLRLFLSRPGMAFTREQLYTQVWDMAYMDDSRTLDMHIRTLRQKLGNCGRLIETVRNVGYRLEATP